VRTYKIAAIPGDGVGKEVVRAGLEVLKACTARDGGFALDVTRFDWSPNVTKRPAF
jgi:tartrate dehydrogenase/decarboxylase / D-malate dehydrogenase